MQINRVPYKVLLPRRFWEQANNKSQLKKLIETYFNQSYPQYRIKKVIQSGGAYIAICERE